MAELIYENLKIFNNPNKKLPEYVENDLNKYHLKIFNNSNKKLSEDVENDLNKYPGTEEHMTQHPELYDFVYKTYQCAIRRNLNMGHFCGYFQLHPNNNVDLDEGDYDIYNLGVHFGITGGKAVCSLYNNEQLELVGFDCAHSGDLIPFNILVFDSLGNGTYKDYDWVKSHIEKIVDGMYEIDGPIYNLVKNASN